MQKQALIYIQLTFDKEAEAIMGQRWYWKKWTTMCKKFDVDTDLLPSTKSNSKWIPDPKCLTQNYKTPRKYHRRNLTFGLMATSKI